MITSPKDTVAAGLPKPSTKFRSDWPRTILAATALALVTTAPALADPFGEDRFKVECEVLPDNCHLWCWKVGPTDPQAN